MTTVLSGMQGIKWPFYLDEIVVFGENLKTHSDRLWEILDWMRKCNLKLQPDKCEFLREEVSYLGHITGSTGVGPDEKRAEAVRNYPNQKPLESLWVL